MFDREGIPLARYEFKYRKPPRRRPRISHILIAVFVLVLLAMPFYAAYNINIVETDLEISDLPTNLKNVKIVYVTDFLEGSLFSQSRVDKLVNDINSLSADLVLLGGNYAQSSATAIEFFNALPTIRARLGVYGVLGENDRSEPSTNLSLLVKAMTSSGVTPLVNEVGKVKLGKTYLYLAGVDDDIAGTADVADLASQVSSDDFVILLGNDPDLLSAALKATGSDGDNHWFDIALFGRTLGGQITLAGFPLISSLVPDLGSRYLTGWREENRANILVSNGVGLRYFPVRIFAPAQIHEITLKKAS